MLKGILYVVKHTFLLYNEPTVCQLNQGLTIRSVASLDETYSFIKNKAHAHMTREGQQQKKYTKIKKTTTTQKHNGL